MKREVLKFLTSLFCVAAVFASCSKSPENIGVDFQSDDNFLNLQFTDTVEIQCHSALVDSISTTEVMPLLGSVIDPVYGLTTAGFYTQLHISSNTPALDSAVVDSVVLLMEINGFYGDTMTTQTFNVYELADSLKSHETHTYYSCSTVAYNDVDLAQAFQTSPRPRTKDTTGVAILRIPLSEEAHEIVKRLSANSSNDDLRQKLYGLLVTTTQVTMGGCILGIDLTDNSNTVMRVYYRDKEDLSKQLSYDFYVTSDDTYFSSFSHDYTLGSPNFKQQVLEGDTLLGRQEIFVQPMAGVRTKIKMPNIDKWKVEEKEHILINEARLIMTGAATDTAVFKSPAALALVMIDDDGSLITLPDISEGVSYYGGTYNRASNTVMFRISEYIQNIVAGKKKNNGLWMSVSGASFVPNRWIMGGSNAEEGRIRLEVKYSIIKE